MGFFGDKHVFLQLSRIVLCGANRAYVAFETTRLEESFLGNRTQFSKGNKVLDAPISDTHDFLQEFHLSLQLSWMGLLETKWAFHHLHKYDLQELFLSKTNSTLRGKQCATCYYFYYTCVCSREFLQLRWRGLITANRPTSTLKHLHCWNNSPKI
jgi:hypothetical protein